MGRLAFYFFQVFSRGIFYQHQMPVTYPGEEFNIFTAKLTVYEFYYLRGFLRTYVPCAVISKRV